MKKGILVFVLGILSYVFVPIFANNPPDEGMWLPIWIEKYNYADMQRLGLKLKPEQLYSTSQPSIKDAIVGLGNVEYGIQMFFCTGEVVSPKGLILTNHHCAYDAIQSLSTVEKDYLTNGFWATKFEEELPIEGMTVSFLIRIEDVTEQVLKDVTDQMSEEEREFQINKAIKRIEKEASEKGKYDVHVKSFFDGNEYYLYVYQTYKDVRLVGAPPSSIGKFGGDTDNWMWPRHTGDFTFLRVYSAPDGSPASFDKNNIPLVPKHYLPISLQGVQKGDFTMIFGFPGNTDRYLSSYGIEFQLTYHNPAVIKIRDTKLNILRSFMNSDKQIELQYASKYASSSNYWKYFIGQSKGLRLHDVQNRRKALEDEFMKWVEQDPKRKEKYGNIFADLQKGYEQLKTTGLYLKYLEEAVFQGPEFIYFSFGAYQLYGTLKSAEGASKDQKQKIQSQIQDIAQNFQKKVTKHFKNYNAEVDKQLFIALMKMTYEAIPADVRPDIFNKALKKHKGSFEGWANEVFSKSIFVNEQKLLNFLNNPSLKVMENDPGWQITLSMIQFIRNIYSEYQKIEQSINRANRLFVEGLRLMYPDKKFYPNANSTMRMTYGKVIDYYPADAVHYDYITTIHGIFEKEDPSNKEFIVDPKLKELYQKKDYGRYAMKDGNLPVCFITDNDITGGNSGSPVINAHGHLVGVAFDGNWESMSGDIQYEPSVQRTICVDIRYVLFVVDKFAGARNLIEEMTIIM